MSHPVLIENVRLKELVLVANRNREFFEEFERFLQEQGFASIHAFVNEPVEEKAIATLQAFFRRRFEARIVDGLGRPYSRGKGKWYFLAWLFRDAPAQRLQPLLGSVEGRSATERKTNLLNRLRVAVAKQFPSEQSWTWHAFVEVMLSRLEGSRRALKGGLFENIVRRALRAVFTEAELELTVSDSEIKLEGETYDLRVEGTAGAVLIPVKTRETMGGGHALLFTRDIHKSITVAESNGYTCIPVVIAESWGGSLSALPCENFILIQINPNQVDLIEPLLKDELRELVPVFRGLEG